jgi:ABC-2 type transport system ATP-binding protein
MIKLIDLTKRFNEFPAVDGINLEVERGEVFCLVGPNGAGKTTTIKMMAGLLKPTAGSIIINGHDLQEVPIKVKEIIGYIPDRPFLYEKLTGREFLRFIAGLFGEEGTVVDDRIEKLLEFFELKDWAGELIEGYSHGMKQRLIISSTLLHSPKVIIVDEPMVGLDPKGIRLVKRIFKALASSGVTIFMTTHNLAIAEEIGGRIGIINEGKLIAVGTMEELRGMAKKEAGAYGHTPLLEDIFMRLTGEEELDEVMEVFPKDPVER